MYGEPFVPGEIATLVLSLSCIAYAAYLERVYGFWESSEVIFVSILIGVALLFPLSTAPLLVACGFVLYRVLSAANAHKIDLTNNPVMPTDVRTAIKNPKLMCDITGTAHWLGWLIATTALVISVAVVSSVTVSLWHSDLRLTVVRVALLAVLVFHFRSVGTRFFEEVNSRIWNLSAPFGDDVIDKALNSSSRSPVAVWTPSFNSVLSVHIGVFSFLLFKSLRNRFYVPAILRKGQNAPAPSIAEITSSIPHRKPVDAPNIVVMQLESVCNPNWAFQLGFEFRSLLFEPHKLTQFITPLRVNIVGGGSWITEFEFLTGLDARTFGDDGLYTHVTLPNFINEAFPAYLRRRGYRTFAFYPAAGSFYNTRSAYRDYGFDTFWDAKDLALPEWNSSDIMMQEAFGRKLQEFSERQFFAYIVTNGAHSPFRKVKKKRAEDRVSFSAAANPSLVSSLERYLGLLRESEEAVQGVLDRLVEVENSTGRPFVLLVYGDHQPWRFVAAKEKSFDAVRTVRPKNQTFAHLMSSRGHFALDAEIPATLLPSVLSGLVTGTTEDLYLPINFYLWQRAGPDMFAVPGRSSRLGIFKQAFAGGGAAASSHPSATDMSADGAAAAVLEAQAAAIQWFRNSTVLKAR